MATIDAQTQSYIDYQIEKLRLEFDEKFKAVTVTATVDIDRFNKFVDKSVEKYTKEIDQTK